MDSLSIIKKKNNDENSLARILKNDDKHEIEFIANLNKKDFEKI
jgi:hypothetical protein